MIEEPRRRYRAIIWADGGRILGQGDAETLIGAMRLASDEANARKLPGERLRSVACRPYWSTPRDNLLSEE